MVGLMGGRIDEFHSEKKNRSFGELATLFYFSTRICLYICISTTGMCFWICHLLFRLMNCQIPKLLTVQPAGARVALHRNHCPWHLPQEGSHIIRTQPVFTWGACLLAQLPLLIILT